MAHYYDGDERVITQTMVGRMSVRELLGLLTHLSNDYDQPWLDMLTYRYDEGSNVTQVTVKLMKDRLHTQLK